MAALFPRWTNTAFGLALGGLIALAIGAIVTPMVCVRTPYNTGQYTPIDQPVEFDHRHHVRDDRIDCLYCHRGAEVAPSAGIPATEVCMGCHVQVWHRSPLLEPVRRSYFSGQPIPWRRVHVVPDFTYFNHAIHVRKGVGCVICHGRVDLMPRVFPVAPLTMGWCLECHRDPRAYVERALGAHGERVEGRGSMWGATLELLLPEAPEHRAITRLTTCSACHR